MKKQFDLNYYLAHHETNVMTRDGHSVRIISTDFRDTVFPVVAFITREDLTEFVACFTINGELNAEEKGDLDLFFDLPDPEKKKVPLTYEDLLERIKSGKTMWLVSDQNTVYNIVDFDAENVYYMFGEIGELRHLSYEVLMNSITFSDGNPCWKEVDE